MTKSNNFSSDFIFFFWFNLVLSIYLLFFSDKKRGGKNDNNQNESSDDDDDSKTGKKKTKRSHLNGYEDFFRENLYRRFIAFSSFNLQGVSSIRSHRDFKYVLLSYKVASLELQTC